MAEEAAQDSAPPRRQEQGIWASLVAWALPLLALGTILHTLALFLPWEHLLVFNNTSGTVEAVDIQAITALLPGMAISAAYVRFDVFHESFLDLTVSILWHTALPLTGIVLLLAYATFRRAAVRWIILTVYAVWLTLLSANAITFVQWLASINQDLTSTLHWGDVPGWLSFAIATGFIDHGPGLETPPSPAWGFWVLIFVLVISWFAWAVALLAQRHSKASRIEANTMTSQDAAVVEPSPSRLRLLSASGITLGALLWCLGVLALPQIQVDCTRPLPTALPARITVPCPANSAFYTLQVVEAVSIAEYPHTDDTGTLQRYAYLGLVRDYMLLALALVALPFALVAAWRTATRSRASWLAAWWVLSLAILLVTLRATLLVLYPNAPPPGATIFIVKSFEESIGPAPFAMALGVVLAGLGLLGVWRRSRARTQLAA